MKTIYFFRVIIISFDFLILLLSGAALYFFSAKASAAVELFSVNSEVKKYLTLLPIGIWLWLLKEAKDFLNSDQKLSNWPDYWKLKAHVYISLLYGSIFCLIYILPLVIRMDVSKGAKLILFCSGLSGCLWAAGSVYFAQVTAKEILNKEF